jgi:hypothetical protein
VEWRGGYEGVVNSGHYRESLEMRRRWRKFVWICSLSRSVDGDAAVVFVVVVVMILLQYFISIFPLSIEECKTHES